MTNKEYPSYWLRFIKLQFLLLLLATVSLVAMVCYMVVGPNGSLFWRLIAISIFIAGTLPYIFIVENWACPRCGKKFFRKGFKYRPTKFCVHCSESLPHLTEHPFRYLLKNWNR